MKRWSFVMALGLTVALAGGVVYAKPKGAPANPTTEPKKDPSMVGMVLKVVDNNITIQTRGKNAGEVVVATDAKTVIHLDEKVILVGDIKPGMELVATPATGTAQKIMVEDPTKDKNKKKKKDKEKKVKPAA